MHKSHKVLQAKVSQCGNVEAVYSRIGQVPTSNDWDKSRNVGGRILRFLNKAMIFHTDINPT